MNDKLIEQLDNAMHRLYRAMDLERLQMQREGKRLLAQNMSLMETRILRTIDEHEQISLKKIRADVNIPNSSLTSIIKKFEDKQLILRSIDPEDLRSFLLKTTEKGHLLNESHRRLEQKATRIFIERVGDETRVKQLISILEDATREPIFSIQQFCEQNEF